MPADVITCDDLKSITEALLSQGICLAQTNTHSSREQVAHNTIQLVSCSINELPTKRDFSNASSARSWKPLLLRRAASREAQPQQKPHLPAQPLMPGGSTPHHKSWPRHSMKATALSPPDLATLPLTPGGAKRSSACSLQPSKSLLHLRHLLQSAPPPWRQPLLPCAAQALLFRPAGNQLAPLSMQAGPVYCLSKD